MNALELKGYLEKELKPLLGTYKTNTGKIYPAIRIYPPMADSSWVVSGIEVSIFETPESNGTIALQGETLIKEWWVMKIVQWDSSRGLNDICRKTQTLFPKVTLTSKPPTIDSYQTAIMSIYDPKFLGRSKWQYS